MSFPPQLAPYIVHKGSIAVDGISLTVAGLGADRFDVQVVPFTLEHTNLKAAQIRDRVNLECDMVGKVRRPRGGARGADAGAVARASGTLVNTSSAATARGRAEALSELTAEAENPKMKRRIEDRQRRAKQPSPFARIEDAVEAFRAGSMIIVVDDEDRENEGDLTIAAEKVTPEAINFMARHGRGLICLSMTPERLDELDIPLMVSQNTSRFETAFCVSIEAKGRTTTGISAADRAATVLTAIDPATKPHDLARPGHMFPLRARTAA